MTGFHRAAKSAAQRFILSLAILLGGSGCFAALAMSQQPLPAAPAPAAKPPAKAEPATGAVIFSRSISGPSGSEGATPGGIARPAPEEPVTDAERRGIGFVSYNLEVHLNGSRKSISVLARMVLRNDGKAPRTRLPLQISSSLQWTGVEIGGKSVAFSEETIASDEDHTGKLREAVIPLPQPWMPGQELALRTSYQGTIPQSSQRLEQIGTPTEVARHSDWDRIGSKFIGLRGFGNVVWYPVVSVPAALGDGDKFFAEADRQKWEQRDAEVSIEVTEEFLGDAPKLAILDGLPVPVKVVLQPQSTDVAGIVTARLPKTRLGFSAPSLFMLKGEATGDGGIDIFTSTEDSAYTAACLSSASTVKPMIEKWLGLKPKRKLTIVQLPDSGDEPYEDGATLFTSNQSIDPSKLAGMLVHGLSHAYFTSPYPWLNEGVANFMGTLWLEHTSGRDLALARMDNQRGALALAEPANPGSGGGESLIEAMDPIYYRTKATYVFWMLRDLAGDDVLARAFQLYNPAEDKDGKQFERALIEAGAKNLGWFFSDWINHDRGLPDLSIAGVYPRTSSIPGSYIVAVTVTNDGGAAAEVPVSVRSASTKTGTRLLIPAHGSATHHFLLNGEPIEASVNDGTVPEVQASVHRRKVETIPPE